MIHNTFPVIDLAATGSRIKELRKERGYSVRDLQQYFGFDDPRAIYKWQKGDSLPTVDNLFALARLLEVPVDDILVPVQFHIVSEQQDKSCCSVFFSGVLPWTVQKSDGPVPFFSAARWCPAALESMRRAINKQLMSSAL